MNSVISLIIFILAFFMYIHIRHYYTISLDHDIIVLNNTECLLNEMSFYRVLKDSGRAKLPCIMKDTTILTRLKGELKYDINYLNLLSELDTLNLCVPFTYGNKENDKKSIQNIYLTVVANEFIKNDIDVEERALFFNDKLSKNNKTMTEQQRNILNTIYGSIDNYVSTYLYNQHIIKKTHMIYFSNSQSPTYIEFQTFKNPLNVFYVLDGECDLIIVHPDYINKSFIDEDYVFFRFYYNKNVFENNNLNDIMGGNMQGVNKIHCSAGDVVLLPCNWFISIKLRDKCVLLNESVSTMTSMVSLIPDYVKNVFYRSTIKIVPNHISNVEEKEVEIQQDKGETVVSIDTHIKADKGTM